MGAGQILARTSTVGKEENHELWLFMQVVNIQREAVVEVTGMT